MLQSHCKEVFETEIQLKNRNEQVYGNRAAVPEAMLPVQHTPKQFEANKSQPILNSATSKRLEGLLAEFWSEEIDRMAYELCQKAANAVNEVELGLKEVETGIQKAVKPSEKQLKMLKAISVEGKLFFDKQCKLATLHADCTRRLE